MESFSLSQAIKDCSVPSALKDLAQESHNVELGEGYSLLFRVGDDDLTVNEIGPGKFSDWVRGDSQRPDGFTGAAVKIGRDRAWCRWWEPERDESTGKVYNSEYDIEYVKFCWENGYAFISLHVQGPALDRFGNSHNVILESFGMGGVDWPWAHRFSKTNSVEDGFKELIEEAASWARLLAK